MEKEAAFYFTFVYISNSTIWAVLFQIWRINFQVRMIYNNVKVKDPQDLFPKTLNSLNYLNRVNLHPRPKELPELQRCRSAWQLVWHHPAAVNWGCLMELLATQNSVNKGWSGSILEDSGSLTSCISWIFPVQSARPESSHLETKPNLIFILQDKWLVVFKREHQKKAENLPE